MLSQRIEWNQRGECRPLRIAVRGDHIALSAADGLVQVVNVNSGAPELVFVRQLAWQPEALSLSWSGRYLLLRDALETRATIMDIVEDRIVTEYQAPDARPQSVIASLIIAGGEEVLLMSKQRMVIEALVLRSMDTVFCCDCSRPLAFVFEHFCAMNDDDSFGVIGHFSGESKYSLLTFSFGQLTQDPESAAREILQKRRISDYAWRLAVGPCGLTELVAFRDPEDDESLSEENREEAEASALHGFKGFYVGKLKTGELVESIERDVAIETGVPLFATSEMIAAVCKDHLELVARSGVGRENTVIAGDAFGIDTRNALVGRIHKGQIEIIKIGPS